MSFKILTVIGPIVSNMTDLFLYCYFGKLATDIHLSLADRLYESNWVKLPTEYQRIYAVMIQNMQKSMFYHGFGIVNLDLETFKKVTFTGSMS